MNNLGLGLDAMINAARERASERENVTEMDGKTEGRRRGGGGVGSLLTLRAGMRVDIDDVTVSM